MIDCRESFDVARGFPSSRALKAVSVLAIALIAGCGKSTDRLPLEGTVTLHGQPVEQAGITFAPKPGTLSPVGIGSVKNGKFYIPPKQGVKAGDFSVRLTMPLPPQNEPEGEFKILEDPSGVDWGAEAARAMANSGPAAKSYTLDVKVGGEAPSLQLQFTE